MGMVSDWITSGVAHLLGRVKEVAAGIVGKVLSTFGLTAVTVSSVLPSLKAMVVSFTGGISGPAADILGYLNVGTAISMILSALTIRLAWKVFLVPTSVATTLGAGP